MLQKRDQLDDGVFDWMYVMDRQRREKERQREEARMQREKEEASRQAQAEFEAYKTTRQDYTWSAGGVGSGIASGMSGIGMESNNGVYSFVTGEGKRAL